MTHPTIVYVPIVADEQGNEMFLLYENCTAPTEEEARAIGWGASLVEYIFARVRFQRVQAIDMKNTPHLHARRGPYDVALIAGPVFDQATEADVSS